MIFDSLKNAELYYTLSTNIKKGLMFLQNTPDLHNFPVGRVEIDGDNVFALVQEYETKDFNEDKWEAHKKYFDIQFIVSGTEEIKVSRIEEMKLNTSYQPDGDYWLFSGKGNGIIITKNQFVILSPEEVHQPGVIADNKSNMIKKIIVKSLI